MASLDSYIKERDEKIQKGVLIYSVVSNKTTKTDFYKLNCNTFKHNNGIYADKTRLNY